MSGLDPNPYRSLHSANPHIKKSRRLPLPESPSNYIQPHIWGGDGTPIQLPATHHTTQFCLKVPQFIMALDEKYAHLHIKTWPVIHIENVPANTNRGCTAARNSLLFKSKSISNWQNGKPTTRTFLNGKVHSSKRFSRNRALHLIKRFLQILILHLAHLLLDTTYFTFIGKFM